MARSSRDLFVTVTTEGGLLPSDLLQRIHEGDGDLAGLKPTSYHLPKGERLNEAVNRSWTRLLTAWDDFQEARQRLDEDDPGTTPTRERWLLQLFQELGYGRLTTSRAPEIDNKTYPVSHFWHHSPIHLVGSNVDLDRRTPGVAGAAQTSPHSLVQEFLNRSDEHLWGFVSNGLQLRVLRDNVSLTRQAYVGFDLEAMMEGEIYADFTLLWLACHQSRVEADVPEECWLERWTQAAQERGTRILDRLRDGVHRAIECLGGGFLAHPANAELRSRLRSGELSTQDYYRQLLRLVYRLIFLFVAEDRDLLFDPDAPEEARERYDSYYSTARLRTLAQARRGTRHPDLYRTLRLVMARLGDAKGCPELGVPPLGTFLWSENSTPDLDTADLWNQDLLEAIRALAFTVEERVLRAVDYRNLGSEELGSVYESLLELHPELNAEAATFALETVAGHERKTTGSYYTPTGLIQSLLDTALEPVLEEALSANDPEAALLDLKVCDPASGSGHFLIAAAHRIARRLAAVRTGEVEPPPDAIRAALRDIIGHCIYGVDVNPMAVELCKVALWMEALEPGRPLSFLDHRILCGNSLLGATPARIAEGIPNDAFKTIEGDDKSTVKALRKQNREERKGQRDLFVRLVAEAGPTYYALSERAADLDDLPDATLEGVRAKEERYRRLTKSDEYRHARLVADAWCAAFLARKTPDAPPAVTQDLFARIQEDPDSVHPAVTRTIEELTDEYQFFHWHLAFPDVFRVSVKEESSKNETAGWSGGFDVLLGNPPWERIAFEDKKFFARHAPTVLKASTTAARKQAISALEKTDPEVFQAFQQARRRADGEKHFYRHSGRFPLGASGRINTYPLFANLTVDLIDSSGRAGIIVPTGIATDAPMELFWSTLVQEGRLVSLYDFENRKGVFPAVDRRTRFSLLTLRDLAEETLETARCAFFLQHPHEIGGNAYSLAISDLATINPRTRQPPTCRSQRDVELLIEIQRRHPIAIEVFRGTVSSWVAFTSSGYSSHYIQEDELVSVDRAMRGRTPEGNLALPLFEGKLIHQFDPCFATYEGVSNSERQSADPRGVSDAERVPGLLPMPRFWAPEPVISEFLQRKSMDRDWVIGIRDNARSTDERTAIAAILPRCGMIQPLNGISVASAADALWIVAALNSFALDYVARQKVSGTHLNVTIFSQLPIPERTGTAFDKFVERTALELNACVSHLRTFAKETGYTDQVFSWNRERRFLLRCALDAAFFHLYGVDRDDVAYILETFPIVKRNDEKEFGEFRTKKTILTCYDALVDPVETGSGWQVIVDPPPAHESQRHGTRDTTDEVP